MQTCKYHSEDGQCRLLSVVFGSPHFVMTVFCNTLCGPNDKTKQINMLNKNGVLIDDLPVDIQYIDLSKVSFTGKGLQHKALSNCCGSTKNIIKGFGKLVWARLTKTRPEPYVVERSEICAGCEHRTFLNVAEWAIGSVQSKDLPINHEPGDWDGLWCSRCRCFIEAKIRVVKEQCPLDKWSKKQPEQAAADESGVLEP